jgi:hypothetical protein
MKLGSYKDARWRRAGRRDRSKTGSSPTSRAHNGPLERPSMLGETWRTGHSRQLSVLYVAEIRRAHLSALRSSVIGASFANPKAA